MPTPLFDEATLTRLRRLRMSPGRVRRGAPRGERLSKQFGAGQEFGAHREYSHGDDLRRVDWNVYGRLGQLFLKLFEQPGQMRVLLVADDAPTMDFGRHNKWLGARRVLGAVGMVALASSDRVLLSRLSDPRPSVFDATGETRLLQQLQDWEVADRADKTVKSARALFEQQARDSVLVLVSDFQDRDPLLGLLSDARRTGVRAIAISMAAREELNPSIAGFTNLQPVTGNGAKLRVDERVLKTYREEVRQFREGVKRGVHATGAAYIELDSSDPIEPLLIDFMRAGVLGS